MVQQCIRERLQQGPTTRKDLVRHVAEQHPSFTPYDIRCALLLMAAAQIIDDDVLTRMVTLREVMG